MKIYVAGKITGLDNYKETFDEVEDKFKKNGHKVMNPTILPAGFEHEEYMKICYAMIDVCEVIYLLSTWEESKGAKMEYTYGVAQNKRIMFQKQEAVYLGRG